MLWFKKKIDKEENARSLIESRMKMIEMNSAIEFETFREECRAALKKLDDDYKKFQEQYKKWQENHDKMHEDFDAKSDEKHKENLATHNKHHDLLEGYLKAFMAALQAKGGQ